MKDACPPTQVALLTPLQADRKHLCTAGAQEGLGLAENLAEAPGKQTPNSHRSGVGSSSVPSSLRPRSSGPSSCRVTGNWSRPSPDSTSRPPPDSTRKPWAKVTGVYSQCRLQAP